ncbi:MAG: hypothetical protein P1P81_00510 [Desulfobulbales bacterium]|nr:hypothetical protein [Desulfobulbales bacterium]
MRRMLAAAWLLAFFITGPMISPCTAETRKIPFSYYDGSRQIEIDKETLDAYHDEMTRFYTNSADLRHAIREKIDLFAKLLTEADTDKEEIMMIQQEIQALTGELQRAELSFRWDLNRRFPELATDKYRSCLGAATGTRGPGR